MRLGTDHGADDGGHLVDAVGPLERERAVIVVFPIFGVSPGAAVSDNVDRQRIALVGDRALQTATHSRFTIVDMTAEHERQGDKESLEPLLLLSHVNSRLTRTKTRSKINLLR